MEGLYPEQTLYFPFSFSDTRELRAQQTYFVKMPREVLEILGLDELEDDLAPSLAREARARRQRDAAAGTSPTPRFGPQSSGEP